MKHSISIIFLGLAVAAMAHFSVISWKTTNLEIGQVKSGELKELSFEFTNDGTEAIQILEARGFCGCTVVDFPKTSILPGASATIAANFKSSKTGQFKKKIKVRTSASEDYTYLYFNGVVVE